MANGIKAEQDGAVVIKHLPLLKDLRDAADTPAQRPSGSVKAMTASERSAPAMSTTDCTTSVHTTAWSPPIIE